MKNTSALPRRLPVAIILAAGLALAACSTNNSEPSGGGSSGTPPPTGGADNGYDTTTHIDPPVTAIPGDAWIVVQACRVFGSGCGTRGFRVHFQQ